MARIRTIKPEFWQSEKLAAMSEHARLMAIALLNHADDEGYFMANVALVRAACFPFEDDSTKCRRSLDDLSCKGFITIVDASNKSIGHVNNFLEHQRIDRPKKSTLKDAFIGALSKKPNVLQEKVKIDEASTNDRRIIDDASLLEQGIGNREQGNGIGNIYGDLPVEAVASVCVEQDCRLVEILNTWNLAMDQNCRMTDKRAKSLRQRLRNSEWASAWSDAVQRASLSDFCRGESNTGWQADFEWFVKPDTVTKILEGKYDNRTGQQTSQNSRGIVLSKVPL